MITATFDLTSGWTFDGDPALDFGIRFADGDADRIYPDALAFGWTVLVNGDEADSLSWPPSNVVIRELTPSRVFPYRLDAAPDDEVTLSVWAKNGGVTVKDETTFTVPRPPQPYPSWVWEEGYWQAPTPYPDDDACFTWDEDLKDWIACEDTEED